MSTAAQSPGLLREEAFEKALCYAGFELESQVQDSIQPTGVLTALTPTGIPFLSPSHSESRFWCFDFGIVPFGRENYLETTAVHRPVVAYVESVRDTGLVWIRSLRPGYNPDTYAWDTPSVTDSFFPPRKGYDGIPDTCPQYSLSEIFRLHPIELSGPKMVDAICLTSGWRRNEPSPTWFIFKHDFRRTANDPSIRHEYECWNARTGRWIGSSDLHMRSRDWPKRQGDVGRPNW